METESVQAPDTKKHRRYASVDFLRGSAIFAMIILHTISDTLDVDYYVEQLDSVGIINVIALLVLPFIGGLAGLFLMTSAIGNMIGMRRNLEKGHGASAVMIKQVIGGVLIVIFAMVTESTIGYHAPLGDVFNNLDDLSQINYEKALYRGYEIETLHTIGWAIIINGIVQGIMSQRYDIKTQTGEMIRAYWILSVIVLILTPILWNVFSALIPGYPFDINPVTGQPYYMPYIGKSPWHELVLFAFINPIAAPVEPIFPYLATSFVGSIVGLQITQPKDGFDRSFVAKYFKMGLFFFIVGFIGVVVVMINILNERDLDAMLNQYRILAAHRDWVAERGAAGGWIWQYLTLNGAALLIVMTAIRISEYRGNAENFAKRTTFIRRFGFIALSIYTAQWIYFIAHFIVTSVMGVEPYIRVPWLATWAILLIALTLFHLIMRLWERKGYIGSLEWMISGIANRLVGVKKQTSYSSEDENKKWYEIGRLKVDEVFYNPDWQNFPIEDKKADERRLIKYCVIGGFFVFPFSFIAFSVIRGYEREHGESVGKLKLGSLIGMILALVWVPLSFIVSLQSLGVTL